jgi:hypothetical protein
MNLTFPNLRLYSISQFRENELVMEGIVKARNFNKSSISKLELFET